MENGNQIKELIKDIAVLKADRKTSNQVHERLDGFKTFASLPPIEEFALYHPKTIDRQEKQNQYYDTL